MNKPTQHDVQPSSQKSLKNNTIIELQNVKKIYQMDGVETHALRGVNLRIKRKDFITIMGPSGSGKSTLLHMVGALDKPTSGKILLDGVDIATLNESNLARLRGKKIGFVFQFFNLHPTLTALENVELPMIINETSKEIRRKKALVCIVGEGMRHAVGLLARIAKAISSNKVNIELIDQGPSERNIIIGVDCEQDSDNAKKVVNIVYNEFFK